MNEALLIAGFILLQSLALVLIVFPLRNLLSKGAIFGFLGATLLCIGAYWQWGNWSSLSAYYREKARLDNAKDYVRNHSSEEIIQSLQRKLQENPKDARAWYWLGRVYGSLQEREKARKALEKSYRLNPRDEEVAIRLAESLWVLNDLASFRKIVHQVHQNNPSQPDALAMLAMDAYKRHDYPRAKVYWSNLLQKVPKHSKEARALQRAIVKAVRKGEPNDSVHGIAQGSG